MAGREKENNGRCPYFPMPDIAGTDQLSASGLPRTLHTPDFKENSLPTNWKDDLFQKWLHLRTDLRNNKKNKNWVNVINSCNQIIQLDLEAKFIGIMIPMFYKEMASAYEKIGDIASALKFYSHAKEAFINYRTNNVLRNPNDWLADIATIDKKMAKLRSKENCRAIQQKDM